jgi:endoglucanase
LRRALAALLVPVAVAGCGHHDRAPAAAFLDRYVASDGRVVRLDQGGDTFSEGQAYALLLSALAGDEARFDRVWRWTRTHLQRRDGLLAWHWQGGRVVDAEPASDADVDTARALALAAERFHRPGLRAQARRTAAAILRLETVDGALVAGPWARERGVTNPSYLSPSAATTLGRLGDARAWRRVRERGLSAARQLTAGPQLPPDWAVVGSVSRGETTATTAQATGPPDAPAILPRTRDSHGAPGAGRSPVALVAAAAAAHAAGDDHARDRLLAAAEALDAERPSYYGSAWVALGRELLSDDC